MATRLFASGVGARRPGTSAVLAVTCSGPLLALMAFTTPVANLAGTATALGAGPGLQAWILSAMPVGTGAAVLSSGAIGDDYGRRAGFVAGAVLLAAASVFGALAPTALLLVLARVLQGIGSAAIFACGLGLIGTLYPSGRARARATAVWAAALGGGVALGPLMSAELSGLAGWRAPYVFVALAGAALAVLARRVLPEARADKPRRIDLAGTLVLGFGIAALLSGFVGVRTGWSMKSAVLLAGGLVLIAAFIAIEWRSAAPMLDLGLFRRPDFIGATVAALAGGAGVLSLVSFLPTLLERAMQMPALEAAAILLAWSATSVASAFGVRWLLSGASARRLLMLGLFGSAAGQLGLYGLAPQTGVGRLLVPLLVAGIAYGILNSALGRQAIESVPADRMAMGGGANNTARYLGSAIGLTIVTVVVTHGGSGSALASWNLAVLVTSAFSLAGIAVVALVRPRVAAGRICPGASESR